MITKKQLANDIARLSAELQNLRMDFNELECQCKIGWRNQKYLQKVLLSVNTQPTKIKVKATPGRPKKVEVKIKRGPGRPRKSAQPRTKDGKFTKKK